RTLGLKLADYDIIGLNEVFDTTPREILMKTFGEALGKDFHCVLPPAREQSVFGIGSGLAIVSRLPIRASHSMAYGNDSSILTYGLGADGFASKGALHARIGRGGQAPADDFLDVFVTHLESKDDAVREVQYAKLAEFIRTHSDPKRPALILGGFNTAGTPGDLQNAVSQSRRTVSMRERGRPDVPLIDLRPHLSREEGGTSDPETPDGGERIDYIFLSNSPSMRLGLRPLGVRVNRFLDSKVTALSDHAAVEAELDWGAPQP